jgi:hypothetical protein
MYHTAVSFIYITKNMIENIVSYIIESWFNLSWGLAIIVFFSYLLIDALNAIYTDAVARQKPLKASNTGAIMYILLALGVISYTQNFLYLIPVVLGSWVGTYIVVSRHKRFGALFDNSNSHDSRI